MSARCTGSFTCGPFEVESYGNGWAYKVTDESGASFWVQDSDADELAQETSQFTDPYVLPERMEVLGEVTV